MSAPAQSFDVRSRSPHARTDLGGGDDRLHAATYFRVTGNCQAASFRFRRYPKMSNVIRMAATIRPDMRAMHRELLGMKAALTAHGKSMGHFAAGTNLSDTISKALRRIERGQGARLETLMRARARMHELGIQSWEGGELEPARALAGMSAALRAIGIEVTDDRLRAAAAAFADAYKKLSGSEALDDDSAIELGRLIAS